MQLLIVVQSNVIQFGLQHNANDSHFNTSLDGTFSSVYMNHTIDEPTEGLSK